MTWARFQGYKPFSEVSGLQWPHILKKLRFSIFDYIFALFSTFLVLYDSLKPKFQSKYALSALIELDLKVINHLVKIQGFSDLIYWKNCDFLFLTTFSLYFRPFWSSMIP